MDAPQMVYSPDRGSSPRGFEQIIGSSPELGRVLEQVQYVAPTDSTVLIEGETGTGKELVAHAIHNVSQRVGRAFIKLNCAAIPLDLLESELFGHEKGAFTGAIAQKIGRFEMADKGTLFLDEVGDIPSALQPKLLRVLQEQEFERLGNGRTHKVDVRLVAASNRSLVKMVARGQFRSDLYYRLNVFPILLPTLRERREDIPALVTHFVKLFSRRMGTPIGCRDQPDITLCVRPLPRRPNSCSCNTRSNLGCNAGGMSPTSSKNSVPLSAISKRPIFCVMAPVKAPFS